MKRLGFKMKLFPGKMDEYKRRHDEIWPELVLLLKEHGISHYYIFLDTDTNSLFATYLIENTDKLNELPLHPVMKKWWAYMKDIMESAEDNSPISLPLNEVFYMA